MTVVAVVLTGVTRVAPNNTVTLEGEGPRLVPVRVTRVPPLICPLFPAEMEVKVGGAMTTTENAATLTLLTVRATVAVYCTVAGETD